MYAIRSYYAHIGLDDGAGGAEGHAGDTVATVALVGAVGRQWQVHQQFAEEEQRTGLLVQQQAVLASPAQAGPVCQRPLQQGCRVDKGAKPQRP